MPYSALISNREAKWMGYSSSGTIWFTSPSPRLHFLNVLIQDIHNLSLSLSALSVSGVLQMAEVAVDTGGQRNGRGNDSGET